MANDSVPKTLISCTSDALALAALPRLKPDDNIVQHGPGGPVELLPVGRAPETWFPRHLAPRPGNEVIPYIYGSCLFQDMAAALQTASTNDHRIYILGWEGEKGTELTPGKTLENYLTNTPAQIRAMFWDGILLQPVPAVKIKSDQTSIWLSDFINGLPNGASIMDSRHAQPATHHQKLLVVQGSQGMIAFIGGMDITKNRAEVHPQDKGWPWHDVHVRITGPAAADCRNVFQERWSDHPQSASLDRKLGVPGREAFPPPAVTQAVPTVTIPPQGSKPPLRGVRIGRTYPRLKKSGGGTNFSFDPQDQGIYTAWDLVEHGIRTTKRFIYLEDQYMVSRMARQLLIDKLKQPDFKFLLILMNNSGAAAADYKFLISERNRFREELKAIDRLGSKWGIYILKDAPDPDRRKWAGTYMHSKTWIFDDEFAIVGSANCENRGYTLNTEAVAGIADDVKVSASGLGFARQLRIALWHKHLGVPHTQVQDWKKGLSLWAKPPVSAMIQKSVALEPDPDLGGKFFPDENEKKNIEWIWTTFCDPDAR